MQFRFENYNDWKNTSDWMEHRMIEFTEIDNGSEFENGVKYEFVDMTQELNALCVRKYNETSYTQFSCDCNVIKTAIFYEMDVYDFKNQIKDNSKSQQSKMVKISKKRYDELLEIESLYKK